MPATRAGGGLCYEPVTTPLAMCDKLPRPRDGVRCVNGRDRGDRELSQLVATLLQITGAWAGRTPPPGLIVLNGKQLRRAGGASSRYRACGAAWALRCPPFVKRSTAEGYARRAVD